MSTRILILALPFVWSCNTANNDQTTGTSGAATTEHVTALDDRDAWQKPEEVIALMGDIKGVTIADLFAEDGYFAFKLIDAGANVIAVVNDADQAAAIEAKKKEKGIGDDRLKVRAVPVGDPGLQKDEADISLIVHHYTKIGDKVDYFARMREGVVHPRPLIMVEWLPGMVQHGPPNPERMAIEQVMDEVGQYGYSDVGAHSAKIPEQVIYVINDYFDMGEGQIVSGLPQQ
ncbi:MAG TPA: hypothetical protein PK760_11995 [Flavobacteriales bacterium]|nr:hypothetical protein [Flavobacteriales bacterium]